MNLLEFKVRSWHTFIDVGEFVKDLLRDLVLVVVFDDLEVELAAHQLHVDLELLLEDLFLQVDAQTRLQCLAKLLRLADELPPV